MSSLSEAQWRSIQLRSVDPYASYYSNIVNRHTRTITNGLDTIVFGLDAILVDAFSILVKKGIAIKDDVVLQFTTDVTVDLNEPSFYIDGQVANSSGIYYLIINYKYEKVKPAPYARIQICRQGQWDPTTHLFLAALQIDYFDPPGQYGITAILDHDPINTDRRRQYPALLDEYKGKPYGIASLDENGLIPIEQLGIDDTSSGPRVLWSSQKVQDELDAVRTEATRSSLTAEYDPYQDWLQQSRYLAVTVDTFVDESLVDFAYTNAELDLENRRIVGLAGHVFQTKNLYNSDTGVTDISKIALAVDYSGIVNFYVSRDGGGHWEPITLDQYGVSDNFVFVNTVGTDLRIRAEFVTDGAIYSYGILYGEDTDWTNVDIADASNTMCWSPPAITVVSGSTVEIGRITLPQDKMLYIKRITLDRSDGGPSISDLFVQLRNETDDVTMLTTSEKWWEGVIALGAGKTLSIQIVNNTLSDIDVLATVTAIVGTM